MPFNFHATTLALGGQLEGADRKARYISSQASVSLPTDGGVGESTVQDFEQDGISFYRAESRVFGNAFENRIFKTYANTSVYGLNIDDLIQVDVLSSTVTSINERVGDCATESKISFDVNIVGLVIDGLPIEVELETESFRRNATFGDYIGSFPKMTEAEVAKYAAAYNWSFNDCKTVTQQDGLEVTSYHVPAACQNGLRASVVCRTTPELRPGEVRGITRQGFTIEVANFGLIHLGEVLMIPGRRSINLLRIERGKTLASLPISRASLPAADAQPGIHAVAMTGTTAETASLVSPTGGSVTVCRTEGNGTDFGSP